MKHQDNYFVRNPHGVVIVVGESEIEHIKNQVGFEILEKVPPEQAAQAEVPQLPADGTKADEFACPICGSKGVGRNRFKNQEDVEKHVSKKHPN